MKKEVKKTYFACHKFLWKWLVIGSIISFGIIGAITPLRTMVISRMRGLWIEISRSVDTYESEWPEIKNIRLLSVKASSDTKSIYHYISKSREEIYQGNLILVNDDYANLLLEKNKLIEIDAYKNKYYKNNDSGAMLNKETLHALNQMMESFTVATGKTDMIVMSAYRSILEQADALQEKVNLFGEEAARRWAKVPGYSEHHSGYAVDLSIYTDEEEFVSYKGQDEYGWIDQNCYQFGFIRRYTKEKEILTGVTDEPWHYRYVGIPHAYVAIEKGFCLEEYIDYLKQYTFEKQHLQVSCDAGTYEIYYVPATGKTTKVPVPNKYEYSVSGNNIDGFIVTVTLSSN